MFCESQVKPSPIVHHSTPRLVAAFCSPTFHFSDLRNWITHTFQPRATARSTVPNAAVDLPFPSPVLTITTDGAFLVARAGALVGTSSGFTEVLPFRSRMGSDGNHSSARSVHLQDADLRLVVVGD